MNRSYLFVPADSERKLEKAADAGADALIFDLEDSVAPAVRPAARDLAREHAARLANAWIRINSLDTDDAEKDLAAVMPAAPAGIVLPKLRTGSDAAQLAQLLDDLEKAHGIAAGQTRILAICTERPEALFNLHTYINATPRLAALSWGAEDLSAALGASAVRDDNGNWNPPYELARSLCLFAAAAAELQAVDTVFTDFRDLAGLRQYALRARRDGFTGMLAIHPAQVEVINDAFRPTPEEIERAQRIVALFAANPGTGTLGLDGVMIDRPHLVAAQRLLELARKLK